MEQFIKKAEINSKKIKAISKVLSEIEIREICEIRDPIDLRSELKSILNMEGYAEQHWLNEIVKPDALP